MLPYPRTKDLNAGLPLAHQGHLPSLEGSLPSVIPQGLYLSFLGWLIYFLWHKDDLRTSSKWVSPERGKDNQFHLWGHSSRFRNAACTFFFDKVNESCLQDLLGSQDKIAPFAAGTRGVIFSLLNTRKTSTADRPSPTLVRKQLVQLFSLGIL